MVPEILWFQGLWKFPCSKCGELVAVAFRVRRSDNVTPEGLRPPQVDIRVYGALTGPLGFGVRSLATKSSTSLASWKNRLPAPGAELCPENAQIVVHRLLQRIDTVDSDEDKALVRWRDVRLQPSSTVSNGIRLTMRSLFVSCVRLLPESDGRMFRCRFLNEATAKKDRAALVAVGSRWVVVLVA